MTNSVPTSRPNVTTRLAPSARTGAADKHWRNEQFDAICEEYIAGLPEDNPEEQLEKYSADQRVAMVKRYYHDVEKEAMRRCVLDEGIRLTAARPRRSVPSGARWTTSPVLTERRCSPAERPRLSSPPLGTTLDEKIIDDVLNQSKERFLLHYNFPPSPPARQAAARRWTPGDRSEISPTVPSSACSPMISPTLCRIVSDIPRATVPRRWQPSAAELSRCLTPASG